MGAGFDPSLFTTDQQPPVPFAEPPAVIPPPSRYPLPASQLAPDTGEGPIAQPLPAGSEQVVKQMDAGVLPIPTGEGPVPGLPSTQPAAVASGTGAPPPPASFASPAGGPTAPGVSVQVVRKPPGPGAPARPDQLRQAMGAANEANAALPGAAEATGEAAATAQEDKAEALNKAASEIRTQQIDRDAWELAQSDAREKYQAVADKAEKDVEGFKFHDYWATHGTGQHIRTRIAGFLMGLGGGVQGVNAFMQNLDAKMARDMDQQKAELSKKITLANAKRQGVKDFEGYVRDQRAALDIKAANMRLAMADEVEATAQLGGAKVDQAKAKELAAKLRADGENIKVAAERGYIQSETERAHAALLRAQARKVGAEAAATRSGAKADAKEIQATDQRFKEYQKELINGGKGPLAQLERIDAMRSELKNAIASGDGTAAARVLEEAGSMLSGGKSTKQSAHLLLELKSAGERAREEIGKLTGNPGAAQSYQQRLDQLLGGAAQEKRGELGSVRDRIMRTELGEGTGLANRPVTRQRALGHITGLFGGVRDANGQPMFQEGGAPAGGQARQYTPMDDQALAWANANPSDPRAAQIHQKQGR